MGVYKYLFWLLCDCPQPWDVRSHDAPAERAGWGAGGGGAGGRVQPLLHLGVGRHVRPRPPRGPAAQAGRPFLLISSTTTLMQYLPMGGSKQCSGSEIQCFWPRDGNHISESLVTIFKVKNTYILCQFCVADPESSVFYFGSGMEKSRSGINIPDPYLWF